MNTKSDLDQIIELINEKKVLFVATKNSDYLRLVQEINLLKKYSKSVDVICNSDKSYFKRVIKVFLKLIRTPLENYDIVFVGFMAQMIIPFFARKWKKKIIITDFFISIYDTLVDDRKRISGNSFLGKIVKIIDKKTIEKSDYIITDTKEHAKYFSIDFEMNLKKAFVLYLEADKNIYFPRQIEKPTYLKDKFVVLYFGSILPVQGVDVVLKAAELLKNEKKIHFLIIGPIGKKILKPELDNITYIEWLSQVELAKKIAYSDLCLAGHFSATVGKAKRTIPGKAYIYDAMQKKIVLGDTPANRELYSESDKYIYVPVGSANKLAELIIRERNSIK